MKKRLWSAILAMCIVLTMTPITAFAADNDTAQSGLTAKAADTLPAEKATTDVTLSGGTPGAMETVRISGYDPHWYVTDGLVLQFDGIYNTGVVGTHSDDATAWTPLVSTVGDNMAINLSNMKTGEGWQNGDGLYWKDSSTVTTSFTNPLVAENGFTWDYSFKLDDDYSRWTKNSNYRYPIQIDNGSLMGSFGRGNYEGNYTRILFWPNAKEEGVDAHAYNFDATNFAQITMAVGKAVFGKIKVEQKSAKM